MVLFASEGAYQSFQPHSSRDLAERCGETSLEGSSRSCPSMMTDGHSVETNEAVPLPGIGRKGSRYAVSVPLTHPCFWNSAAGLPGFPRHLTKILQLFSISLRRTSTHVGHCFRGMTHDVHQNPALVGQIPFRLQATENQAPLVLNLVQLGQIFDTRAIPIYKPRSQSVAFAALLRYFCLAVGFEFLTHCATTARVQNFYVEFAVGQKFNEQAAVIAGRGSLRNARRSCFSATAKAE